MEIGEGVKIESLLDLDADCPFEHELKIPPEIKNNLEGKGSYLATNMNNGSSTKLYKDYAPKKEKDKVKWGKLPQKDPNHDFYKGHPNKGRCLMVEFKDVSSKEYPVSCSAHHLIPSQESLKGHELLEYMCKEGTSGKHNHGFSDGAIWSDVGYETNGSENGVYLPGSYAVGGGTGGLRVWYSADDKDDDEHDTGYIEVDKLPATEYNDFLLYGERGNISTDNACWHYAMQAMLKSPGQFHDRHADYSKQIVKKALKNIYTRYKQTDILANPESCPKCEKRRKKIEDEGIPAPYSVVKRLEYLSKQLRKYLTAKPGSWKENIYTSEWCNQYMQAVLDGGKAREEAEYFE